MHINKDSFNCCGCSACASKCPKQAITMEPDDFGFLYPVVDESNCIHCGLCIKVCKFEQDYDLHPLSAVYGARLKETDALVKSQSGGAFWAFASSIIHGNGVVYGAAFLDDLSVAHIRVSCLEELERLRTSKYVQSNINGCYKNAQADLKTGLKVLFTGTPCQIAGLYSFLGKEYENLYTISLVCHGVPAPQVWRDYLLYMTQKSKKEVVEFKFRDKLFGWHSHMETFIFSDGSRISERIFRDLFYGHYILRDSCHNCPFTSLRRVSDITISDFWGWENFSAEFADNKGVSLILVSTKKGEEMFNVSKAQLEHIAATPDSCLQPQLKGPVTSPHDKDQFRQVYVAKGFSYAIHHYGIVGWRYNLRRLNAKIKGVSRRIRNRIFKRL